MEIIMVLILIIGVVVYYSLTYFSEKHCVIGQLEDIDFHFKQLQTLADPNKVLIVMVEDTGDFLQFTGNSRGVQLDLPLFTERQIALSDTFYSIAQEFGLIVIRNRGPDGARFLDINLHGNLTRVSSISSRFIQKLYNIQQDTNLIFASH